jgi:hypothetical protein
MHDDVPCESTLIDDPKPDANHVACLECPRLNCVKYPWWDSPANGFYEGDEIYKSYWYISRDGDDSSYQSNGSLNKGCHTSDFNYIVSCRSNNIPRNRWPAYDLSSTGPDYYNQPYPSYSYNLPSSSTGEYRYNGDESDNRDSPPPASLPEPISIASTGPGWWNEDEGKDAVENQEGGRRRLLTVSHDHVPTSSRLPSPSPPAPSSSTRSKQQWDEPEPIDPSSPPRPRYTDPEYNGFKCQEDGPKPTWFFNNTDGTERQGLEWRKASSSWDMNSWVVEAQLPKNTCMSSCRGLQANAIIFCVVFGLVSILLTVSLLCARTRRSKPSEVMRSENAQGSSDAPPQQDSIEAHVAIAPPVDSSDVVIDPDATGSESNDAAHDVASAPGEVPAVAVTPATIVFAAPTNLPPPPPADAPFQAQLGYACVQLGNVCKTFGVLLMHLFVALKVVVLHGSKYLLPWSEREKNAQARCKEM